MHSYNVVTLRFARHATGAQLCNVSGNERLRLQSFADRDAASRLEGGINDRTLSRNRKKLSLNARSRGRGLCHFPSIHERTPRTAFHGIENTNAKRYHKV